MSPASSCAVNSKSWRLKDQSDSQPENKDIERQDCQLGQVLRGGYLTKRNRRKKKKLNAAAIAAKTVVNDVGHHQQTIGCADRENKVRLLAHQRVASAP